MRTNFSATLSSGKCLGLPMYEHTPFTFFQATFILPAFVQGKTPARGEIPAVKPRLIMVNVHIFLVATKIITVNIRFAFIDVPPFLFPLCHD